METYIDFTYKWKRLRHRLLYQTYPKRDKISIKINKLFPKLICPIIKENISLRPLYKNLLHRIQEISEYVFNATNYMKRDLSIELVEELAFHLIFMYQYEPDLMQITPNILTIDLLCCYKTHLHVKSLKLNSIYNSIHCFFLLLNNNGTSY